jgi:hypothetical protein
MHSVFVPLFSLLFSVLIISYSLYSLSWFTSIGSNFQFSTDTEYAGFQYRSYGIFGWSGNQYTTYVTASSETCDRYYTLESTQSMFDSSLVPVDPLLAHMKQRCIDYNRLVIASYVCIGTLGIIIGLILTSMYLLFGSNMYKNQYYMQAILMLIPILHILSVTEFTGYLYYMVNDLRKTSEYPYPSISSTIYVQGVAVVLNLLGVLDFYLFRTRLQKETSEETLIQQLLQKEKEAQKMAMMQEMIVNSPIVQYAIVEGGKLLKKTSTPVAATDGAAGTGGTVEEKQALIPQEQSQNPQQQQTAEVVAPGIQQA